MSRRRKDPLRPLTDEERMVLTQIARAQSEPASHVARAKMLLAAAGAAGRERIVAEVRRTPDRERDGTATWTLTTLQRALRQAPDGLPHVSTYTILCVMQEAGLSWQESRSWCETGKVKRQRKAGVVDVTDPDTEAKKS